MAQNYFYPPAGAASTNASVGSNGSTAPASSTEIGGIQSGGNLKGFLAGPNGEFVVQPPLAINVTGSLTATGTLLSQDCSQLQSLSIHLTSMGAGNTVVFQVSNDNSNWYPCAMMPGGDLTSIITSSTTAAGSFTSQLNSRYFRAQVTVYGSGTVTGNAYFKSFGNSPNSVGGYISSQLYDSVGTGITSTGAALDINIKTGSIANTSFQATQATAANLNATVVQPTAGNLNATVVQATAANLNATVIGTVSVNALPTGTNTIGSVKVTDGTNTSAVKAASTAPAATDTALVVSVSPNSADPALGTVAAGTAAAKSYLTGGVFNTALPTLTTGQQAAIQLDASGRQILGTSNATIGAAKVTDGTNTAVVQGASTQASTADAALTVTLSPNQCKAASATLTNVAASVTTVTVLALNISRKHAVFFNDSTSICYLKFGSAASTSSYTVQMAANSYYELPTFYMYNGILAGIWIAASGNMRVTELT